MISTSISYIHKPTIIALLTIGIALIPVYVFWAEVQERKGKPVLIPNSLWKNMSFTITCVMVLLTFAMLQTVKFLCNLLYVFVCALHILKRLAKYIMVQLPRSTAAFSASKLFSLPAWSCSGHVH